MDAFRLIDSRRPPHLVFTCNVCGRSSKAAVDQIGREIRSCKCGSTVRFRAVARLVAIELTGNAVPIESIEPTRGVTGADMTGWDGYTSRLAAVVPGFRNTFLHMEPRLDITDVPKEMAHTFDFLISSDVFEHVPPPVSVAFANARKLLKPGGLFILTVPFGAGTETVEHFPELHEWDLIADEEVPRIRNTTQDGRLQEFDDLRFHGGDGLTVEMRVFTASSAIRELESAGFEDVQLRDEPDLRHGIVWDRGAAAPITARAPLHDPVVS